MNKLARNLRYGDQLADGRYVLKTEPDEDGTRIVFVGGTSITVPGDEQIELRRAGEATRQPMLFAPSATGQGLIEYVLIIAIVLFVIWIVGKVAGWPW